MPVFFAAVLGHLQPHERGLFAAAQHHKFLHVLEAENPARHLDHALGSVLVLSFDHVRFSTCHRCNPMQSVPPPPQWSAEGMPPGTDRRGAAKGPQMPQRISRRDRKAIGNARSPFVNGKILQPLGANCPDRLASRQAQAFDHCCNSARNMTGTAWVTVDCIARQSARSQLQIPPMKGVTKVQTVWQSPSCSWARKADSASSRVHIS